MFDVMNVLIILASLTILYFAYFKKSEIGKLSVYVLFAAQLLQRFFTYLSRIAIFDFLRDILTTASQLVIYGEIVLLIVLLFLKLKTPTNKYYRMSLVALIVLKIISVLGLF